MSGLGILPPDTNVSHGANGTLYARSPHPLGSYPASITHQLEHWAATAPGSTFLARRGPDGAWITLSYGDVRRRVRSVAQALLDRRLSPERPVVLLSGNGLEHAVLGLAAMYAGVPYAPIAPSYSLRARDLTTLRSLWSSLQPGLVFADAGAPFERALATVAGSAEVVTCSPPGSLPATAFAELEATRATETVDAAHARVGPDTIAKILFTSGLTGRPKGVVNTQRMLCSNQQMLRQVLPFLGEEPPILCDWLPWNHTFGGNHNVGIVLFNGGTLYLDDGQPAPGPFEETIRNLREVATTAYFNVPRGYDLLVPRLVADAELRRRFFSRLRMLFCAAASLRQSVADDLQRLAVDASGRRIPLVTGLGATESAPFALCAGDSAFTGGRIGVPVPGVELKLAPVGDRLEGRLRGPNITPGYWRDEALTRASFDEEGFYRLGDALRLVDPDRPSLGFAFEGRINEDFKLSSGTWVRVGALRGRLLAHFGALVQDVVIAGHDRDVVCALVFPNLDACRAEGGTQAQHAAPHELLALEPVRARFRDLLAGFARDNPGSSTSIARVALLDVPPSIDALEATEKGSVNQKAVLANRAAIVERLYAGDADDLIVDLAPGQVVS